MTTTATEQMRDCATMHCPRCDAPNPDLNRARYRCPDCAATGAEEDIIVRIHDHAMHQRIIDASIGASLAQSCWCPPWETCTECATAAA